MDVLIACEESQAVCIEFRNRGHNAFSCDIKDSSGGHPEWHLKMDAFEAIESRNWDLMIGHPPCTFLCNSGMHWTKRGLRDPQLTEDALEFVQKMMDADIPKIAIENPISIISTRIRKPDQIIRPFMFGDDSTKGTCLWLKGLSTLSPTNVITPTKHVTKSGKSYDAWWYKTCLISNLEERARVRSRTFKGIAEAMADQWGGV
jgi:hypothetical protein